MSKFVTDFLRFDYGENDREKATGKASGTDGILLKINRDVYII